MVKHMASLGTGANAQPQQHGQSTKGRHTPRPAPSPACPPGPRLHHLPGGLVPPGLPQEVNKQQRLRQLLHQAGAKGLEGLRGRGEAQQCWVSLAGGNAR